MTQQAHRHRPPRHLTLSWEASFSHSTLPADPTLGTRALHLGGCPPGGNAACVLRSSNPRPLAAGSHPRKPLRGACVEAKLRAELLGRCQDARQGRVWHLRPTGCPPGEAEPPCPSDTPVLPAPHSVPLGKTDTSP